MNDLFSPTNAFLAVQFLITMYVIFKVRGSSIASHVAAALQEPTKQIADRTAELNTSTSELNTTVKQLFGVLDYTMRDNTRLVTRVDTAESRANTAENKVRDLETRIDASAKSIANLLQEQDERAKATVGRDQKIEGLTQKFDVMTEAFNETKQDLEKTKSDLDKTRSELEVTKHDLDVAKRDLVAAQSRISELERQRDDAIKAASTEKLALETQLQEARGKVAILEDQVKLLEGKIEELQTQLDAQKVKTPDTSLLTLPESTP